MSKKFFSVLSIIFASFIMLGAAAKDAGSKAPAPAADPNKIVLTDDNVITMNTYFEWQTTAKVAQRAKELDAKLPSGEPMYLVLDTGGGSIDAGLELAANLKAMNRPVHTISLFAASMGFQTVEALGDRLVLTNGTLMTHKAAGGFSGEFPGQLDSRYAYYLKRIQRLDEQVVARSGGKHTLTSYRNLYENEYWCDGQDCVDQGFADRVVTASCGESLKGTSNQIEDRFIFMGMTIEIATIRSKCPVVTGVLDFNIYIDGKPLFSASVNDLVAKSKEADKTKKSDDYSWYNSSKSYNVTALGNLKDSEIELLRKQIDAKVNELTNQQRKVIKSY